MERRKTASNHEGPLALLSLSQLAGNTVVTFAPQSPSSVPVNKNINLFFIYSTTKIMKTILFNNKKNISDIVMRIGIKKQNTM